MSRFCDLWRFRIGVCVFFLPIFNVPFRFQVDRQPWGVSAAKTSSPKRIWISSNRILATTNLPSRSGIRASRYVRFRFVRFSIRTVPFIYCVRWFLQQDCPNGRLTPAKFVDMYKMFFPSGNAEEFCDHVFRTFDMDQNGYIDFKVSFYAMNIWLRRCLRIFFLRIIAIFDNECCITANAFYIHVFFVSFFFLHNKANQCLLIIFLPSINLYFNQMYFEKYVWMRLFIADIKGSHWSIPWNLLIIL